MQCKDLKQINDLIKQTLVKYLLFSKHMLKKKAIKRPSLMEYLVQSTEKAITQPVHIMQRKEVV